MPAPAPAWTSSEKRTLRSDPLGVAATPFAPTSAGLGLPSARACPVFPAEARPPAVAPLSPVKAGAGMLPRLGYQLDR